MKAIILAMASFALFVSTCSATPIVSGEIVSQLGRKTSWKVYDEFSDDNPVPSANEFTYVYHFENLGTNELFLYGFRILKFRKGGFPFDSTFDSDEISFTGTNGSGETPNIFGPGLWGWVDGNEREPLFLGPGDQTVDLIATSHLAPGPIIAEIYGCDPIICNIAPTGGLIGPAVPEPTTWLLASLAAGVTAIRRRQF